MQLISKKYIINGHIHQANLSFIIFILFQSMITVSKVNEIYISKSVEMNEQDNNNNNNNNNNDDDNVDSDPKVEKLIKGQLLRYGRRRRLLCKNGKS